MKRKWLVHPAVIAVWAAVVAAGYLLPAFPIWGTGGMFSFANVLNPLSGIFFGPLYGALCSAVGGFIGSLIAPHTAWLGLGTFIIGMTTAFTSGCIAWGKLPPVKISGSGSFVINGGIIIYIIGTILWFTQETGRSVILYPLVVYGLGFISLVTGIIFSGVMFASKKKILNFLAFFLCTFGGLIGGAALGNFFSMVLIKQPKEIWTALAVYAPIERAIFSLAAVIAGFPLLTGLRKMGIITGPGNFTGENSSIDESAANEADASGLKDCDNEN